MFDLSSIGSVQIFGKKFSGPQNKVSQAHQTTIQTMKDSKNSEDTKLTRIVFDPETAEAKEKPLKKVVLEK